MALKRFSLEELASNLCLMINILAALKVTKQIKQAKKI